jgi:hypothetical protein
VAEAERTRKEAEQGLTGAVVHESLPLKLTDDEKASMDRLQARAKRLRQMQKLFKDDPELMRIVDVTIGNQLKAAEERQQTQARLAQRRQTAFSVVFSVLSLIAGWLLSAVSPVSAVARLVGH